MDPTPRHPSRIKARMPRAARNSGKTALLTEGLVTVWISQIVILVEISLPSSEKDRKTDYKENQS
jgi:hypothetical protein